MTPDETPTPNLTERHLDFAKEARKHLADLDDLDAIMTRGPLVRLDIEGARYARALSTALTVLAKKFDLWRTEKVDSANKMHHVAQLQGLTAAAAAFIEEHRS